jgi:hypothetical protein
MSETRRFRLGIWAVVFFVLVVSVPGWFVQMRLIEKLGRLEKRVVELESRVDTEPEPGAAPASD